MTFRPSPETQTAPHASLMTSTHTPPNTVTWCNLEEDGPYLVLFGGLRQDGAALFPERALVSPEGPEQGLLLVTVLQQHPQAALSLPMQLVGEQQAQRPLFRPHFWAHQPGSLPLQTAARVHAQEVANVWNSRRSGLDAEVRVCVQTGRNMEMGSSSEWCLLWVYYLSAPGLSWASLLPHHHH